MFASTSVDDGKRLHLTLNGSASALLVDGRPATSIEYLTAKPKGWAMVTVDEEKNVFFCYLPPYFDIEQCNARKKTNPYYAEKEAQII